MQVYATTDQRLGLGEIEAHARRVEAMGYHGLCVPDAVHDGLLMAQAALRATERLRVATHVLVAFPRSPMQVAIAAWDLQAASGGRFELGLGTQVRGNLEKRYSTPWTAPVPRMREYVLSLRAIWKSFQEGVALDFEGEHYHFSRLQPYFNPGPIDWPEIPVSLGAVGPRLTELAGEVADGWMTHPTNTSPRFLREAGVPALESGAERSARSLDGFDLLTGALIATGPDADTVMRQREEARSQLAFLFSTPAYWRSLALFGWEDVGAKLHTFSRQGKWSEMGSAIHDEMLDTLVPQGDYSSIPGILKNWYEGLTSRLTFPVPTLASTDEIAGQAIQALRALASSQPHHRSGSPAASS